MNRSGKAWCALEIQQRRYVYCVYIYIFVCTIKLWKCHGLACSIAWCFHVLATGNLSWHPSQPSMSGRKKLALAPACTVACLKVLKSFTPNSAWSCWWFLLIDRIILVAELLRLPAGDLVFEFPFGENIRLLAAP